ncbi:TIGR03503 family protein [Rheinheimera sp. 4Y26]|uniref:TIGR03503 family protein n=1 Tax=Rheinheimera sp. 4Y26 TaxID=2977811 RepID=UPI0021B0C78A|nr:TIGR03503 family protein [Rheinheimera sp. 4Y26]MCT6701306.1 TIGR03503 family protein [Rheinheimera sp. 4Y26]
MAKLMLSCLALLCCAQFAVAQSSTENLPAQTATNQTTTNQSVQTTTSKPTEAQPEPERSGLVELPDISASNQIPLLDNRFRIDFEVKEITLVFFRKRGTPPVVLVKPDGSKIYWRNAKEQQVIWHEDKTYDLIKISNPTPGPWQAIGQILPESRIMVLTDIDLEVDKLPTDLMVGETLKVTARLTNGGKPINARDFRDILQLDVLLISTQKPEYDNHLQTVIEFTSFKDDGKNFDEKPRDAIFTGEFKLDFPAGEWIPKYIVKTPLYTRELIQDPILVHRTPLATEVKEGATEQDKHMLTYNILPGPAVGNKVSLQGRIRFPSEEVQSFTLGEQEGNSRTLPIVNAGFGTYRVEHTMFGKTSTGRDFVMTLPEVTFAATGPKLEVPQVDDATAAALKVQAAQDGAVAPGESADGVTVDGALATGQKVAADGETLTAGTETANAEEAAKPFPIFSVILLNLAILVIGGGAILLLVNDNAKSTFVMLVAKLNPVAALKHKKAQKAAQATATDTAGKTTEQAGKAQKNSGNDDILDLSLPDD